MAVNARRQHGKGRGRKVETPGLAPGWHAVLHGGAFHKRFRRSKRGFELFRARIWVSSRVCYTSQLYIYIYVPWRLKRVLEARWRLRTIREGLPSERDGGGLRPYRFESSTSYLPRGNRLERKFKLSVVITLFSGFHILLFIHMYSY